MKTKLLLLLFTSVVGFACNKHHDDVSRDAKCGDRAPDGSLCQAVFQSWLYNSDSKSCELKSYSGCSILGFTTKEECEKCKCK